MDIIKLILFVCAVAGLFFACFTWPVKVNRAFRENYSCNGWSWPVSFGIAALSFLTLYESGSGTKFALLLSATLLFSALSLIFCFLRAKGISGRTSTALAVTAAQALSAFGIVFCVLVFLEASADRKRKRRNR